MCIRDRLEVFRQEPAELVIPDIMMPGTDGLTVCRELRSVSDIPIILLTAKDSELDYGNIGNSAKLPAHGKAVRAGHHNVQYYKLRRLLTKRLQQRVAVFKGAHGRCV